LPSYGPHGRLADSWWTSTVPPTAVALAAESYVGVTFNVAVAGRLFGFRAYLLTGVFAPAWGVLWDTTTGSIVYARHFFQQSVAPGPIWYQQWMRPTLRMVLGHNYRLAVLMGGQYARQNAALVGPVTHTNIQFVNSFQSTAIEPHQATIVTNTNANGVDVLFQPDV
jgi:hypothetical protein